MTTLRPMTPTAPDTALAKAAEKLGATVASVEILTMRYHVRSDGWEIINGKGDVLALTMIPLSQVMFDVPGRTITDKLRWVIDTGQVFQLTASTPPLRNPAVSP